MHLEAATFCTSSTVRQSSAPSADATAATRMARQLACRMCLDCAAHADLLQTAGRLNSVLPLSMRHKELACA